MQYLRATRDSQALRLPSHLKPWELAALAAEAGFYGLEELHQALETKTLSQSSRLLAEQTEYKVFSLHEGGHHSSYSDFVALLKNGWEVLHFGYAGAPQGYGGTFQGLAVLRRQGDM